MEKVIMPKTGVTVTDCILTKWHIKKGQFVKKGDILFSYETDKTSADEESPKDGVILDILCQEGDVVPCLAAVCVIGEEGETCAPREAEARATDDQEAELRHAPRIRGLFSKKTALRITKALCCISTCANAGWPHGY